MKSLARAMIALCLLEGVAALASSATLGGVGGAGWTERQAESISTVRGLAVRVRHCRGLGPRGTIRGQLTYGRFACVAGARLVYQPIDTVAVTYVLLPLGPYRGRASRYALTDVRFGGLGVP